LEIVYREPQIDH